MEFLAPAALALGLLAVPILLLYMLRQKRHDRLVSSSLLWRDLVLDRTANAPWQRLRRNLLLLLQLLILALLVLALARPAIQSAGQVDGNLIVVLDTSASMGATDGPDGATRLQEATAHVERLIAGVGGGDQMTIITAGRAPAVLSAATGDRERLRAALSDVAAENSAADWPAALALAAGLIHGMATPRIVIVSDGGLPADLPAVPAEVTFLPVGRSGENLALATLGARPAGQGLETLLSVANTGSSPGRALLSVYVDDLLFDSRQLDVAAEGTASVTWTLPAGANVIEARLEPLEGTVDYLSIDNRAWHVAGSGTGQRVWLISDGNLFLERFFNVLPGYEVVRVRPDDATPEDAGSGFFVFDGVALPETLPAGNVLIINPQPDETGLIQVTGSFTQTQPIAQTDDPLLTDVDWRMVNIAEAQTVSAPGLVPLITAPGGALLLAGEIEGRRVVLLPFDLSRSDLPLQIAFPALMANIAAWLNPGRAFTMDETPQPGSVVSLLPDARAESITVIKPNGERWQEAVSETSAAVIFEDANLPGRYTVFSEDREGTERPIGEFAINFFNPGESRIQPANALRIGQLDVTSGVAQSDGRREIGLWLLGAGLIVLLLEWWVAYHRRATPLSTRS